METQQLIIMSKRKVTVIIPFNRDRGWLNEAVNSVPAICELILSRSNNNRSYNINEGIKKVKTEFVKFLDEDDRLTENCIEDSLKAIRGFDFIHGNAINFFPDGKEKHYIPSIKHPTLEQLVAPKSSLIHNPTQMYRTEIFDRVGYFDESLQTAQDWEFNLRCLSKGLRLGYCNEFLIYYRIHKNQITKTATKQKILDKQKVYQMYA